MLHQFSMLLLLSPIVAHPPEKKNIEISWGFQLNGWLMDAASSIIEGLAAADTNPGCRSLVSAGHNKAPQNCPLLPEFIMQAAPEIIERLLS